MKNRGNLCVTEVKYVTSDSQYHQIGREGKKNNAKTREKIPWFYVQSHWGHERPEPASSSGKPEFLSLRSRVRNGTEGRHSTYSFHTYLPTLLRNKKQ